MTTLIRKPLLIKQSSIQGYGVFADCDIQAGDVIEECYVLVTNSMNKELINYYFYGDEQAKYLLPAGCGLVFNHADDSNASYVYNADRHLLIFTAKKFIPKGEEIFLNYGPDWFPSRKIAPIIRSPLFRLIRFISGPVLRVTIVIAVIYLIIALFQGALNLQQIK